MKRSLAPLSLMALLAACGDGQPFPTDEAGVDTPEVETPVVEPVETPPEVTGDLLDTGTTRPTLGASAVNRGDILRTEATSENGGYVSSVAYDATSDTFEVDGLGFDGANVYSRGTAVSQLRSHQVYDADLRTPDDLNGTPINQNQPYRAIYGVSNNTIEGGDPRTSFAIVRTGGYVQYGFGGFLYERNGDVVVPTEGQAVFRGDYAGTRVFTNSGGLELTRGDVTIAVDFEDFNTNNAVRGAIFNREALRTDGSIVPLGGDGQLILPQLNFVVRAGGTDINAQGEFSGELNNFTRNEEGALEVYESGNYFAILAGDATDPADGGEVVGVFIVESEDPRFEGVTAQETGGFIAYR